MYAAAFVDASSEFAAGVNEGDDSFFPFCLFVAEDSPRISDVVHTGYVVASMSQISILCRFLAFDPREIVWDQSVGKLPLCSEMLRNKVLTRMSTLLPDAAIDPYIYGRLKQRDVWTLYKLAGDSDPAGAMAVPSLLWVSVSPSPRDQLACGLFVSWRDVLSLPLSEGVRVASDSDLSEDPICLTTKALTKFSNEDAVAECVRQNTQLRARPLSGPGWWK